MRRCDKNAATSENIQTPHLLHGYRTSATYIPSVARYDYVAAETLRSVIHLICTVLSVTINFTVL